MSTPQSYEAAVAGSPDKVAEFDHGPQSFIQKFQHALHVTPSLVPLIVLVMSVVIFGLLLGAKFFSPFALTLILQQVQIVGVLALAQTLIILTAGIDLSRVLLVHPRVGSDGLWAVEQTLRSGTCGAVLAWLETGDMKTLRRLQLAAEAGCCWGLLFRPERLYTQASPAALRIKLEPEPEGLAVHILKRRGGWATGPVHIKFR